MNLKEQLVALLELQTIDTKVKELDTAIRALPLDGIRRDLAKLEGLVGAERQRVTETQAWRKQQEDQLQRDQDAMRMAKSKLSGTQQQGIQRRDPRGRLQAQGDQRARGRAEEGHRGAGLDQPGRRPRQGHRRC